MCRELLQEHANMLNHKYEIKKLLEKCKKNEEHQPQSSIINYYTDKFLNGKITSEKLHRYFEIAGYFQSKKNFKHPISPKEDIINSDDDLRVIIREEIYRNVGLNEGNNKQCPQSQNLRSSKKKKRKRLKKLLFPDFPKKIVNDDPKIKKEMESTEALLKEFEEKNQKELESTIKSLMVNNSVQNNLSITNSLSLEEKEVIEESDQYRIKVNEKQNKYWGSL